MQIRDTEKLKVWLLKKLQPLCDADPAALSKYIVALLRKEKPRSALKDLCINQLEVFLSKETPTFVDKLFRSLDSESYMTGGDDSDSTPPSGLISGSNRSSLESVRSSGGVANSVSPSMMVPERIVTDHRRQSEDMRHREVDDDDRDFRRAHYRHEPSPSLYPAHIGGGGASGSGTGAAEKNKIKKKIEIDPPRRSIRQRLGNREDERRRRRPRSRSRSRSSTPDRQSSRSSSTTPPPDIEDRSRRKRIHTDPMGGVSNDLKPVAKRQRCKDYDERGMCLLGEQCPFDHGNDPLVITGMPPYPPPPPPPPFPLSLPPHPPPHHHLPKTNAADGYNPEDPSLTAGANPPPLPPPPLLPHQIPPLRPAFPPPIPPIPRLPHIPPMHSNPPPTIPSAFTPVSCQAPPIAPPTRHVHYGGAGGGAKPHPGRSSDTIVLRKIPKDLNTITKLSGYFEKFGNIVNLQVRYENDPESAIVQFSSPSEAKAAHDCTEAVLNNRFIRVYYLKGGLGGVGVGGAENKHHHNAPPTYHQANKKETTSSQPTVNSSSNKQPQEVISTSSPSLPPLQAPPAHSYPQHRPQKPSPAPVSVSAAAANLKRLELQKKTQSLLESQIQQQKLLLDKLEKCSTEEREKILLTIKSLNSSVNKLRDSLSSVAKATASKPNPTGNRGMVKSKQATPPLTSSTMSLQQQADQLRMEAQQLGILPSSNATPMGTNDLLSATPTYTKDQHNNEQRKKVEPKTRQLLVVNVEDKEALVKYFESFGGLTQVERGPDNPKNLIFTFKSRNVAEKAAKGSLFQGKPLIMKWYTPKPPPSPTEKKATPPIIPPPGKPPSVSSHETKKQAPPTSLSLLDELKDLEAELQEESLIDVYTPEQSVPRVVHLLDDEEEELDERSWRH
ncbi:PREDICTED: RNA-binding protein 27-like [Amphimedon queenslandica]|uniref:RNA-binding protein 26 n=1 Tax=Amphimedon queenslandica TaxID=400682 RepID=A0A1X7VP71_AMPQE|nr:PREDICTED: RNA-binding protein 27-like [Amphimedon queenslandica]|eukprot:XP_019862843.1 PREDICTED: RNA-binding protein 27-like [Amphimedon queenslandica]